MPITGYMYADDVALTCSDNQTLVIEHTISKDLNCVSVTNNNFERLRYDYLLYFYAYVTDVAYVPEVESRTQLSRPRTHKKSKAKDRPPRGQGPRSQGSSVLQKKRSPNFFRRPPKVQKKVFARGDAAGVLQKKGLPNFFARFLPISKVK